MLNFLKVVLYIIIIIVIVFFMGLLLELFIMYDKLNIWRVLIKDIIVLKNIIGFKRGIVILRSFVSFFVFLIFAVL